MRKTLMIVALTGLMMACGTKNTPQKPTENTVTNTEKVQVETPTVETPAVVDEVEPFFTVETFELEESKPLRNNDDGEESFEEMMTFKCHIDLPATDNQILYDSICRWFGENFGYDYHGDPRDLKSMMEHYKEESLAIYDEEYQEGFETEYTVKLLEANDQYVTYQCDMFYEATSDPRASFEQRHVTFDRNTGQRFGYPMINKDERLESLVKKALLEQYFSDYPTDELSDVVFFNPFDDEEDSFSLPIHDPWILHNSVCFGFGVKEVGDYCVGMPECSLPYSIIEPYLTEKGKAYFNLKE